jgi:hypothetical protein
MFEQQFGTQAAWREPDDVVRLADGQRLTSRASRSTSSMPRPYRGVGDVRPPDRRGHVSRFADAATRTLLSGDVLFAGSIGRSDLPGGDPTR